MSSTESAAQVEQFLILAKGQKSKALETIIDQILSHPSIYVFGEFLSQQNFIEIGSDNKYLKTLQLFAYDTYTKYKNNKADYLELKPQQVKKLKMISIADTAQKNKILYYQDLMSDLDIQTLRELEDLIIDCIYNELLSGKLDQLNKQFHVVHTYGRDLRDQDIDSMLQKLEDWDNQLEKAQILIEENVQNCNTNIMNTYEKQFKFEIEIRERKEEMLKNIREGNEGEYAGSGPGLSLGKKKSSRKHDEEGGGGSGGFLSGLKAGFFNRQKMKKANYHQHQQKLQSQVEDQYNEDNFVLNDRAQQKQYKKQTLAQGVRPSTMTLEDDDDDLDLNVISNKDLEEKIRKMREKIRRKQEGEQSDSQRDQESQNYDNDDENEDNQQQNYYGYDEEDDENHKQEVEYGAEDEEEVEESGIQEQVFGDEDDELSNSQLKKVDLKSKIDQMKQAIAQYQNKGSDFTDGESINTKRQLQLQEDEQLNYSQSINNNYPSSSSKSNDMTGISSSKNKSKQPKHNFQKNRQGREQQQNSSDDENTSRRILVNQKSLKQLGKEQNLSKRKPAQRQKSKVYNERDNDINNQSDEKDQSESEDEDEDEYEENSQVESENDDGQSKYTVKSKKSQKRSRKTKDKSPQNTTQMFDINGFQIPTNPLFLDPQWQQNPALAINPLFLQGGASAPGIPGNPLFGISPLIGMPSPGLTNPLEIAAFYQQQQLLSQQQAQQTFGPNIMPNFMLQQPQFQPSNGINTNPLLNQSNLLMNQQQQQLQQQQQQQQQRQFQEQQQQLQSQVNQANQDVQIMRNKMMDYEKEIQQLQMIIQDQKVQYEQEIKILSRETQYTFEDYQRLKNDNQFLLDKHETMQQKYQSLKREFDNQKEFYEKALEQRFNQMEEFEEECMHLRERVKELEDRENDNRIKCELATRDKEDLKKKLEQKDRENFNGTKKEEELLAKIEDFQCQLKEKESVTDKKVEENFNLKQKIEIQRQEFEKQRKKVENLEDQLTHKELQFKQMNEDFEKYKKKQKYDQSAGNNVIDEIKGELMIEKQQNNSLRQQIDHLQEELFGSRDQSNQSENIRIERDQLRHQLQQLQNQNKNQRSNNENLFQNGSASNRLQKQYQQREDFQEAEITWNQRQEPITARANVNNHRLKQNNFIEDQPSKLNNKYNLPPSFFQDNDYTEDQILNQALYNQKPLLNDRANNLGSRQVQQQQQQARNNQSYMPPGIQTKQDKEREQKMEQVKNIEQNLLSLQLEQKKLQGEFDKIPDNAKTIAQRRRKEELDREIKIVNKNISGLKNKLRELDALHR